MTRTILTEADVAKLVTDLVDAGTRVVAPVPVGPDFEEVEYRSIERLDEAVLDGPLPRRSLKELLRPPRDGGAALAPQVVLGARPCDAAGAEKLDDVMGWDYRDEHWRARRAPTTVVTVACRQVERSCFCGAVGLGPDSTRGADAILVPLDDDVPPSARRRVADALRSCVDLFLLDAQPFEGAAELQRAGEVPIPPRPQRWAARAVTLKGAALLRGRGAPLVDAADRDRAGAFARAARDRVARNLDALRLLPRLDHAAEARLGLAAADGGELVDPALAFDGSAVKRLPEWLARNYDHELWRSLAARCQGCGNCSAVCSTSPCFDVDERDHGGSRPAARPTRTEQFRQRVMHKFSIHPRRYDEVLCTGCGRCSRTCEGRVDLPEVLGDLVRLAGPEPRATP